MFLHVTLPIRPVFPARLIDEDDRHWIALSGLHERQGFHRFIMRAEAARKESHGACFLEEHQLAREEEAAVDKARILADKFVRRLFEGKPDINAEAVIFPRA